MYDKIKCACCGHKTVDKKAKFYVCDICGWEKDGVQEDDPNYKGGANKMSLNEAKEAYTKGQKVK